MTQPAADRLYALLPYLHRLRDAERGEPLRMLLRVLGEQVDVLEADLDRLYDDWFIETCDEAMVPYLGELVGWEMTARAGAPGEAQRAEGMLLRRTLAPRADVARALAHRRRRGTLPLLEELARVAAGWPARAAEFYRLLSYTQPVNHPQPERGRAVDVRDGDALARLGGPFESAAHTVDLRRATSPRGRGRYNLPSVGVFVWRLRAWPVTACNAYLQEGVGRRGEGSARRRGCFHFNILQRDTALFVRPEPEPDAFHLAGPRHVPARLTRHLLSADLAHHYGPGRSLCVWLGVERDGALPEPVPVERVMVADLTDWRYEVPEDKTVLLDPERGRFKVRAPASGDGRAGAADPIGGVRVSYHYGFSAAIGGGEYDRDLVGPAEPHTLYAVGEGPGRSPTLAAALARWRTEQPPRAIIEVASNGQVDAPGAIDLGENRTLILRAADRHRPVLWQVDAASDRSDSFTVLGGKGSRFALDGFLVTGRGVEVNGALDEVVVRHCTLEPPQRREEALEGGPPASLTVNEFSGDLRIDRSIVGPILLTHRGEPARVAIVKSIVDAGHEDDDAFSGGLTPTDLAPGEEVGDAYARAALTVRESTVFGRVVTHALPLAENSLFAGRVVVARRRLGCVRFCYVPDGSLTPRRYRCQPDLSVADARRAGLTEAQAADRARPVWTSRTYGDPAYAQLWRDAPREIARGADDGGEMGALHDLYWPQREDALSQRLAESVPAGMDAGIFFVT
ncbi:MAG: hypothetical protein U0324_24450 [Polyangiales bacterium]